MKLRTLLILLFLAFAAPLPVSACPLCKEAIPAPDADGSDAANLPAAYNNSIYMMIGVPYASLGFLGFFIYRGVKKNAAYLEQFRAMSDDHSAPRQ